MPEYRPEWRAPMDAAWATETHLYPSHVELAAIGQKGGPDVQIRCEMRDGVPEVVDFRITAKPDGRGVRTADLNAWQPLEAIALNGFRRFARSRDSDAGPLALGPRDEREHWQVGGQLETARSSRNGPSRAELEEVARVYRSAIDGRPTEAVQVQIGYSRRTAARRVQQARAAGLLPPTTPGKKNG